MSKAKAASQETTQDTPDEQEQLASDVHHQIDLNDPTLTGQEAVEQNLAAQASTSAE